MKTYAVTWREPDGQTFVGSLALGPLMLHLDGRRRGVDEAVVNRQFGYEELGGLRIGNRGTDRLDGRTALVVERAEGVYLVSNAGPGAPIVQELVERLGELVGFGETSAEPLGRAARPEAASSVVPIATAIGTPCVLASERASHPSDERRSAKPSVGPQETCG